jgi:hypothetical protein
MARSVLSLLSPWSNSLELQIRITWRAKGRASSLNREQFDMTTRKDLKRIEVELEEPVVPEPEWLDSADRDPVGRIVHDARGNAVWKWRGEGDTSGDTSTTGSTSGILKHLDPLDLKVQGSGTGESQAPAFDEGGGYDPYNQGAPKAKTGIPKKGSSGKR